MTEFYSIDPTEDFSNRYYYINNLFGSGELSWVSSVVVESLFDEMIDIARSIL